MALELDYGVPGSGKSYKAVNTIYQAFLNEKSDTYGKYQRFFCNIAEFKFDKFDGRGFKLVPNDLISKISQLRLLAVQGKEESEILDLARSLDLLDSLFVWDEAQTFFSKKNDVLLWWVEYHRHLHQDIILIAQSPDRIISGYKDLGDFHFMATPPSLRTTNALKYKRYSTPQLYKYSHSDTITLKPDPRIFDLYKSGANEKPKKVIYKFLGIAAVLVVVLLLTVSFIMSRYDSDDSNTTVSSSGSLPVVQHFSEIFTVACVGFECSYLGSVVSLADLNARSAEYGLNAVTTTSISEGVTLREYPFNVDFIKGVFNVTVASDSSD